MYVQAVCCSDKEHCCPENTTCDLATSMCLQKNGLPLKKWKNKLPSVKSAYFLKPAVKSNGWFYMYLYSFSNSILFYCLF